MEIIEIGQVFNCEQHIRRLLLNVNKDMMWENCGCVGGGGHNF